MYFNRLGFYNSELVTFYKHLMLPRMIEEKMLLQLRQGKINKWFSGIGQEAIAVGTALALESDEWILPLHRNLGVFTTRQMPLHKLFLQWMGDAKGYSNGRERSFHFGSKEHHICGMISHLGPQLAVADGIALAHQLKKENKVVVVFSGDGGTSQGDFHEALNIASVWNLPVIFVVENNGYALSTPTSQQYGCINIADKAIGYGIHGVTIDGNNVLQVYDTIKRIKNFCLAEQRPYLIECTTFRLRGHEEGSNNQHVPKQLLETWQKKDPVKCYEQFLVAEKAITEMEIADIRNNIKQLIEQEWQLAEKETSTTTATATDELKSVLAKPQPGSNAVPILNKPSENSKYNQSLRFVNAIQQALEQSMQLHPNLLLMGQDIAEHGGVFKVTEGLLEKFGAQRVRNTPLCESGVIGAALGLSIEGFKTVVEMQFADFVTMGFNQIVNNLAKLHYRWGQNADVVIRMPTGAGVGGGPFHSQSTEAWFTRVPGLQVVYPSSAHDAKGLLNAAINNPNPVLFFEHKALYRSISGTVNQSYYQVPIGKAFVVAEGADFTIITYGMGVHWALEYQQQHPEYSIHLLDLRTLLPLDTAAIYQATEKTGRVLLLQEDTLTGGICSEIGAWIAENCFSLLDAPLVRCASLDTPIPFNQQLESQFLAKSRLHSCVQKLLSF